MIDILFTNQQKEQMSVNDEYIYRWKHSDMSELEFPIHMEKDRVTKMHEYIRSLQAKHV